jgi:hypothetical protein
MGIESLCRRDWLHAIALFRQALLEFQHEMNVSTTTSSSSIAATATPTSTTQIVETKTVMYISSIQVGPLFDLYQTAYSFRRQQQQQVMILVPNIASVAAAAAVGVKATTTTTTTTTHSLYINTTTKNNHEMISSILLYNLGLANHLMGTTDQSRMTPALQCSQQLYYLALQGVMGGGFNSHENNNNNNNHHHNNQGVMKEEENETLVTPTSASSVSLIGIMLHENEDVNKSRSSSSGGGIDNGVSYYGEERRVLILAIISNLRHIHQSFYDYDDIMFTTNLLQIVWQEFVEYKYCRSSERLDNGVVVVNNDTPPLTRDGRILLSPTIVHRMKQVLLSDDDVIYFLLSLLLESEPFINGAASA